MTGLALAITERFFQEGQREGVGEEREPIVDFLSTETRAFLESNGFAMEEHIDPHVCRFFGSFLTDDARRLLSTKFKKGYTPLVWINCNENSDFGCPNTFQVEIGIKDERRGEGRDGGEESRDEICTFGVFGSSSPFCATVEAAMKEAAMAFLFRFCTPKGPNIICWRRRRQ